MKLIKFTSILLCFLMFTAMFAGCDTPEESKADISESNIREVSEEVSTQESEVLEDTEQWRTWSYGYEWDFLEDLPVHYDVILPQGANAWEPYPHYSTRFHDCMGVHNHFLGDTKYIVRLAVGAYDYRETQGEKPMPGTKRCDPDDLYKWLKAGFIPTEREDDVIHIDVSYNDMEQLIECGFEAGFHLVFSLYESDERLEGKEVFECSVCEENETEQDR
ncbi:MAG: hypothetical protein II987_00010 [Clostridia bacterium]|nr:hypothetical protein [Clostridia bacterium]